MNRIISYLNIIFIISIPLLVFTSCSRDEVDADEITQLRLQSQNELLQKTKIKHGPPKYEIGISGGTRYTYILNDPKTFNTLTARDSDSRTVIDVCFLSLFSYNAYEKQFISEAAEDFSVEYDTDNNVTYVYFTLRDDLAWTTANGNYVPITVDDIIYWYNEIEGDKALQNPGYPGQFVTTSNGEKARIQIEKIDTYNAKFIFPTILANPLLSANMSFGPKYIYEPVKQAQGVEGLLDILSIDTDPKDIPSMGQYMITEYQPGQQIVLEKNPNFWKTDAENNSIPYIQRVVIKIISSQDAALLSFQQKELSSYGARPEDLDSLLAVKNPHYDVYNVGSSLSSDFLVFNQNPNALSETKYKWFSNTYFRQAMSSLLPRMRIIQEVYRGLGTPARYFFAKANMFFDDTISLPYTYNPKKAIALLKQAGFSYDSNNMLVDTEGNQLAFELLVNVENTLRQDIGNIYAEELKKIGITLQVRSLDFQSIVEKLTKSYAWDSTIVGLGTNYWPSSGSNVWQSNGNFHLWYPLQESPATEWEAEIDALYQQGMSTIDLQERKSIYDRYQEILLEQLPVIYIIHPHSFSAYDSRIHNLYLDTLQGSETEYLYFK